MAKEIYWALLGMNHVYCCGRDSFLSAFFVMISAVSVLFVMSFPPAGRYFWLAAFSGDSDSFHYCLMLSLHQELELNCLQYVSSVHQWFLWVPQKKSVFHRKRKGTMYLIFVPGLCQHYSFWLCHYNNPA